MAAEIMLFGLTRRPSKSLASMRPRRMAAEIMGTFDGTRCLSVTLQ